MLPSEPRKSLRMSRHKPDSQDDDIVDRYERRHQDFNDRVSKCDTKNAKACGRIKLACKETTLVEIKDISSVDEVEEIQPTR